MYRKPSPELQAQAGDSWGAVPTSGRVRIYAAGRVIGQVRGGVFEKRIHGSRHLLRSPRAICLDAQSLADAERAGALEVHVTDAETGITYRASTAQIRRFGFDLDRGFGAQIALTLPLWSTGDRQPAPVPLFGGHS